MAAMSGLMLGASLLTGIAGTALQYMGAQKQAAASKRAAAADNLAQQQRTQAAEFESKQKNLQTLRAAYVARGSALNAAGNSGSALGSGLPGEEGNITNTANINMAGNEGELKLAQNVGEANKAGFQAKVDMADAGSEMAMGSGISSLGNMFVKNMGAIDRIGQQPVGGMF